MNKLTLNILIGLVSTLTFAQVQFIDVPGTAYLLRENQKAALVITDAAANRLAEHLKPTEKSHIHCGPAYCVIGEVSRAGFISPLSGQFATPDFFQKFADDKPNPRSPLSAFYERFGSRAATYADQCQDPSGRRSDLNVLIFEGIAAEQLYNFLNSKAGRKQSSSAFNCEKSKEYDPADTGSSGAIYDHTPVSYIRYRCEIKISEEGLLQKPRTCTINGGSISAGGGGGGK